jgi:hypothetical protein
VAAPRNGADGIDRSIRINKSLLDHPGLLGSGYLGVPARVLPSTPPSPGWKEVPCPTSERSASHGCWIVTADHLIPPAAQLAMAQHAQARIVKVDASHLSMISHPQR